jgi:hypothetical protein
MLTTITAFVIMFANPNGSLLGTAGQEKQPYFFKDEKSIREYDSKRECEQSLANLSSDLGEKLNALYLSASDNRKQVEYRTQKARFDSLQCVQVTHQPGDDHYVRSQVQEAAEKKQKEFPVASKADTPVEVWRIGRFDDKQVFYGTQYNKFDYESRQACDNDFGATLDVVEKKALDQGAAVEQADGLVSRFDKAYDCTKIVVAFNDVNRGKMQAVSKQAATPQKPLQAIAPQRPQYDTEEDENRFSTPLNALPGPRYSVSPKPIESRPPTRPYFMAEQVRDARGYWQWVLYSTAFQSPAQCWEALNNFTKEQEALLQRSFSTMQPTYSSATWYQTNAQGMQYRRKHMSCVIDNRR